MSVLDQSGEEQVECPLCMEPLEVDDLNFFPCTCGYQICRFCWHRIRTDENGLCPACRKAYSENPADFTPLSKEEVAQLKAKKRQRDQQRKAKLSESRKHLANVRVVQKNLVFVVGLPLRLADAEILKRHEYFGKFGKIHKVVINQSTSYAGTQGPSASAYVTYMKSDDALRAIQSVNNITIDGRIIKSSLGTTKYCSHFMKNQPCPKPDCMYLHDFGDPKASFTKEQMHVGKHQEYERKLHDILLAKMELQAAQQQAALLQQQQNQQNESKSSDKNNESPTSNTTTNAGKDNWPQLSPEKSGDKKPDVNKTKNKTKIKNGTDCNSKKPSDKSKNGCGGDIQQVVKNHPHEDADSIQNTARSKEFLEVEKHDKTVESSLPKLLVLDDNSSFFSQNTFQKIVAADVSDENCLLSEQITDSPTQLLNDSLPNISSSEDWEAAFGFTKFNSHLDELAKQGNNIKDTLETFGNSYSSGSNNSIDMFGNIDPHYSAFDTSNKLQESILEALNHSKHQQFGTLPFSKADRVNNTLQNGYYGLNGTNGVNGIDHQMSKLLQDIYKKEYFGNNGSNTYPYINNIPERIERNNFLLLQQRQLEEQLLNLNLKHTYNQQLLHNGLHNSQYLNGGDILTTTAQNGLMHNQFYQNSVVNGMINNSKTSSKPDDLDFDPFHETQKGFAELIQESEQNHKLQSVGHTTGLNGLIHSPNSHLPPPPPGFMQNNTHMNSFGSKMLPYLNMGISQPHQSQISSNSTHNNWSGNYNQIQQQQQQQQLKGLGTCNDWKVLDPAIVTTRNNLPYINMQHREHYNNIQAPSLQNGPSINTRSPSSAYDYANFTTNYNPQVQTTNGYNNFSHITTQQSLNWLGNEINSQITSPPGFRSTNHQTSKQEC